MNPLTRAWIAAEWRHHPWRHAMAVLAVALGVALAWSVHVINASALAEFSAAVRSANGQPDAVVRGPREGFDDRLLDTVAGLPGVASASPVVEIDTYAALPAGAQQPGALSPSPPPAGRLAVRVLGLDALVAAPLTPGAMPRPAEGMGRLAALDPTLAFLNAAARERLALRDGDTLSLQAGPGWKRWAVGGSVAAGGTALVVMDIASAQAAFGWEGRLSRIDLRVSPGHEASALVPLLPAGLTLQAADEAEQRVSQLSRAYRTNLTVLALVALFVGAFLVYSVVALSVAQRTPSLALLGVLGGTAAQRRHLVLAECALIGTAGSVAGLALGTALAAGALRWLAGDLGGGYFPGIAPPLQVDAGALAVFGALGVAAALVGGWVPARRAQQLQPAQALKGLGYAGPRAAKPWPALALLAGGTALSFAPPVLGLPLAAYAGVAALLVGGVAAVPWAVDALLAAARRPARPVLLLALQRARHQRHTATAAVAGVVASLALSVALTVMVASFRDGVAVWLDRVLPADLYARSASSAAAGDQAWLPPDFVQQVAALKGVRKVEPSRSRALQLAPGRPSVTLVARDLADPASALPMIEPPLGKSRPVGGAGHGAAVDVYVSEAVVALYGAGPGSNLLLPLGGGTVTAHVRGVWRDYARQFGAIAIDAADYRRLTGDDRVSDLALWLAPGASPAQVQQALRAAAPDPAMLEFAATAELRRLSLAIFDRSFAVTYYLQALAISIGLIGVAASLSAQVLARRKEFGLLAHLGLTRGQVLAVVAGETAAWLAAGIAVGLALGAAISAVLVHVVNPQSFHWTMELVWPWARLAALAAAVFAAGIATTAIAARHATSLQAVRAVREDW